MAYEYFSKDETPKLRSIFAPMRTLRLTFRLLFFVVYTARIVAEIWLRKTLFRADMRTAMRVRRRWARRLLKVMGVRLEVKGNPPDFPCLLVGNHRSYLDPILMLCHVDGYPVAKAELATWPLIGKGARLAGILYLHRESSGSRASILKLMHDKIAKGFAVIIFPEGTTSALHGTLPFKKGGFQMAARYRFPVVPTAVVFEDERDFWIGQDSFWGHAGRRFREKEIRVQVIYGPILRSEHMEDLMDESKKWIDKHLGGMNNDQR